MPPAAVPELREALSLLLGQQSVINLRAFRCGGAGRPPAAPMLSMNWTYGKIITYHQDLGPQSASTCPAVWLVTKLPLPGKLQSKTSNVRPLLAVSGSFCGGPAQRARSRQRLRVTGISATG